MLVEEATLCIW